MNNMPNRIYSFEEIIKLSEISLDRLIANYQEIYGYAPFWEDPVGNLLLKLKRIEQVGVTFGQKQDIKNVLAECDSAKLRSQNSIDLAGKQLARIDISNQDDMFYVRNLELHKKISEWMPKAENGFFLIDNIKKYCQERINQIEAETEIHHAERLSFSPRGLESKQKQKQDNSILKSIENIELTFNDLRMVEEESSLAEISSILDQVKDLTMQLDSLVSERNREKENYEIMGNAYIDLGGAGETTRAISTEQPSKGFFGRLFDRTPKVNKKERKEFFETTMDVGKDLKNFNLQINRKLNELLYLIGFKSPSFVGREGESFVTLLGSIDKFKDENYPSSNPPHQFFKFVKAVKAIRTSLEEVRGTELPPDQSYIDSYQIAGLR